MRLAWFRATPPDSDALLDRTAPLIAALRRTHDIDVVTAAEAHDFVWKHGRQPYDVCVYEVADSPAHRFIHPYLLHYPGVAFLTGIPHADRRTWNGSRIVVVSDPAVAQSLACEWPAARLRVAPLGSNAGTATPQRIESPQHGGLTLALLGPARRELVERAIQRARERGIPVAIVPDTTSPSMLHQADVIVALEWPPAAGPPLAALHAMALGRPVVVLEVEATAGWPAFNPQTWQPRGSSDAPPIAVSVDPRDEEHSLMLAIVRLAADPSLRKSVADAGHAWWHAHATIDHAVAGWEAILREAATLGAAAPHLVADGSERARNILAEMGVEVDFL